MQKNQVRAILLIHCPDQKGILASITSFLAEHAGNITELDEHVDNEKNCFFMRAEWEFNDFDMSREDFKTKFELDFAIPYQMKWSLYFTDRKPKMAVFVSKLSHCLYDILARYQSQEWEVEIPVVISNHEALKPIVEQAGIPFFYIPVTRENKAIREQDQRQLLEKYNVDFIVLARYMQILSQDFIEAYRNKIINIHHSFLPAFPGARPYHSAFARGVKIIGATSHYVTEDLDAGPIIEQDVARVTHKDNVQKMLRKGQDLEKIVLSRAIWNHLQRRILIFENKTVVFD